MNYVLGFAFDVRTGGVLLIHKTHPEWQKHRWNGIGGKVEGEEKPLGAMVREFEEETGIQSHAEQWRKAGTMLRLFPNGAVSWIVHVFTLQEALLGRWQSKTEETVGLFGTDPLGLVPAPGGCLENIPALIELCRMRKDHTNAVPAFRLVYE